jgi:hypothetical protein
MYAPKLTVARMESHQSAGSFDFPKREASPMSNEQEKTATRRDAIIKKDIAQARRKPNEEERSIQDALEDDDVREVLECRNVPRR